jgi:hypothetical protein
MRTAPVTFFYEGFTDLFTDRMLSSIHEEPLTRCPGVLHGYVNFLYRKLANAYKILWAGNRFVQ